MAWSSVRHLSPQVSSGATRVSEAVLSAAENQIEGCAECDTSSDVTFLAMVRCLGADRTAGTLALDRAAKCPNCGAALTGQSLVCWD